MKRALIQNTRVAPYTSGAVIDRNNFLSMIFAAIAGAAGDLILTITHCDTEDGTYEAVKDTHIIVAGGVTNGGVSTIPVADGDTVNVDIDLVGCKQFVKIAVSGSGAEDSTFAYAVGDPQYAAV